MEARRSYDKDGNLKEIQIVLKFNEARDFVNGYDDENLVNEMCTVVREALELEK